MRVWWPVVWSHDPTSHHSAQHGAVTLASLLAVAQARPVNRPCALTDTHSSLTVSRPVRFVVAAFLPNNCALFGLPVSAFGVPPVCPAPVQSTGLDPSDKYYMFVLRYVVKLPGPSMLCYRACRTTALAAILAKGRHEETPAPGNRLLGPFGGWMVGCGPVGLLVS